MDITPIYQHFNGNDTLLPPGFRFHPTDEELITHYLLRKVLDTSFTGRAITEVDLNKCEPWELPEKAKMGEKEWFFFSLRDRKYPTGLRTNRATDAGYWKATGKDREIFSSKSSALVGMKKTLVFYRGRAPRGEKSNWVIHEYRLEGKFDYNYLCRSSKDEWVLSRLFQKSGSGNVATVPGGCGAKMTPSLHQEPSSPPSSVSLPPLLDPSTNSVADCDICSYESHAPAEHVSCFSTFPATASNISATDFIPNFDFTLPPPPPLADPTARFTTNMGMFLQDNLQLPFFIAPTVPSTTLYGGSAATWESSYTGSLGFY